MKLLYFTNGIHGSGGLERVLAVKASYLAENYNYEVSILTLNSEGEDLFYDFSPKITFYDIKASGNPISYFLSYWKGIKKVLKYVKPDVISVCDDGLKGILFPLIFGKKIPVIYERHVSKQIQNKSDNSSFKEVLKSKIVFYFMNYGGKRFNKFVVLTKGNLKEWNLTNLMVISNPLPFNTDEKSSLMNKKILAVGKQSFQKGYDRLLESWEIVYRKHPDWKLEVYGNPKQSLGLEKKAKELGISKAVSFYPPVKDIQEKYKDSSIYLMSSRFEGFGMVLIEAMSFGLPCISFDCPYGPADIISDGEDGFLIENDNIEDFGRAIIKLIENEPMRKIMGVNAKENIQRFYPEIIVKQWDELFKSLI
ncbi:MAG: glycosyltransferase involved in cell wall biosynthesis [Mariniflexile sp.]|jgi:glycosyltransferase involved in cell wall biosynthesis